MQDPVIQEIRERIEAIELSAGIPRKPWTAEQEHQRQPKQEHQRQPKQEHQRQPKQERRGPGRPRKAAES